MKQTNINIDEIKRFPTVTNPIKADDLHTPQAYAYTLRRAIVTDCNDRQRAELVALLEGRESAEGVTFNNTRLNRDRLHIWQNSESRKERAAILGEGWQYIEGLNHGTQPGDLITCLDGTQGRVTKSSPESCCIEFETADGHRLSVAGYFRYTPSEKSETAITEAEGVKVGDKVRHNLTGNRVATVTGIRRVQGYKWQGEITVYRLDFGESVKGPFGMEMNGGEYQREAFTFFDEQSGKAERQDSGEIKPKAAFQIGDRVERKSDGERGTVDGYDVTDGKLTYIVKYDRTQRRQSDGFDYLSEELNGNELQADSIESLTAKYAKQIEESALLGCGCMVGDGDETRKDSKCVKVRTAYKNDSHDAKDWTYCVSWYETTPIKGDADGQHQTLRECENGILLEQAARHMAYFELMARKGWTLDEILYGKAA